MELIDVLKHEGPPRTEYFLEIPSAFGKLRLDLAAPVEVALTQTGVTAEMAQEANKLAEQARQQVTSGNVEGGIKILQDGIKEYPYASVLYGALYDIYTGEDDLTEAEYYIKQALALQPDYRALMYLGRNLGRQGQLEQAALVQGFLWEHRKEAAPDVALEATHDYLVTLGRQVQPDKMLQVIPEAMQQYGGETTLWYQYIFALTLADREDEARAQLEPILPKLDPNDPLYPRFMRMRDYLGLQPQQ